MPLFTANAYLSHGSGVVKTNEQVELTEEQAKRLGDKVSPYNAEEVVEQKLETAQPLTEDEFYALTADKQKELVTGLNGDLNEHTNADKRWAFVSANQ